MTRAHGVQGRFPFLDHRVFEFAASLPSWSKLRGLREKEILRRWATRFLPLGLTNRGKQQYRVPDAASFFKGSSPDYVQELLSPEAIRRTGIFDAPAVAGLLRRCIAGRVTGAGENQALVAILSTQLWHHAFLERRVETPHWRHGSSPRSLAASI